MDSIEQAIFTSAETSRGSGYQLVATSPGVCEADARELAAWGPSHDALLDPSPSATSVNFHALPSGAYCVSRTTPSGFEYSGRGGMRVYTQNLIVPPSAMARFSNNPFALIRAAVAGGALRQYEQPPETLPPLQLAGRAAAVDAAQLARLCMAPGPEWLATLVQAAMESVCVAIVGGPPAEHLIAGLLNCLPVECRGEFSFSTGLKFSSRRPFRIVALSADVEEQRRIERLYNVTVLRLDEPPPVEFAPVESWSRFIHRALKSGSTSFLSARLSRRQSGFMPQDLPALGLQYLEELDASETSDPPPPAEEAETPDAERFLDETSWPAAGTSDPQPDHRRAHASHPKVRRGSAAPVMPARPADAPSKHLSPEDPAVLAKLEQLDDVVFEAAAGKPEALEQLKTLWPKIQSELGERLLAESREQYIRYALSVWSELQTAAGARDTVRAVHSLEVLTILFDRVE